MKAIAILIVLAGTVLSIQAALPNVGDCSFEAYYNKIRTCHTKFIKGLQQNPRDDCSVHRDSFINCCAVAAKTCFPIVTVEAMRNVLKLQLTEELMCKRAGLQQPDPSKLNMKLPCSITTSEYMTKNNDCTDSLVKKWSANRADPTICREYSDAKKCSKNVFDKYCQFKGVFLEAMNYQYDNYNPFCPNNVDPFSKDSNNVRPTSKVSSIAVSKAAIVISLVVAAIQAF